jgi:hypothetical protein
VKGELLKRRSTMLKMTAEAYPLVDVVNQLSGEYDVSPQAIYKDWRKRGTWQTQLLDIGSLEQLCKDLYATHKEIYRMAMAAYRTATQDTAKIGALRLLRDINLDFAEMFPRVINSHIKDKRGDDINSLLKQYKELYEDPESNSKNINIQMTWLPRINLEDFTEDEVEQIREAARLVNRRSDERIRREGERARANKS